MCIFIYKILFAFEVLNEFKEKRNQNVSFKKQDHEKLKIFADLSLLYNPLLYSGAFFWPPLLLPCPPAATTKCDFALTPEKEEPIGDTHSETLNSKQNISVLMDSSFTSTVDEDMPLNLSTKPQSSATTPTSRFATTIWSPASMCEKPSADASRSSRSNSSSSSTSSADDRDPHTTTAPSGTSASASCDATRDGAQYKFKSEIINRIKRHSRSVDDDRSASDRDENDMNFNMKVRHVFANQSSVSDKDFLFFPHFAHHKDIEVLRQNRTDIFAINGVKQEHSGGGSLHTTPDSTGHGTTLLGGDDKKRDRNFQVLFHSFFISV